MKDNIISNMMNDNNNDISQDDIILYEKIEILLQHPNSSTPTQSSQQKQQKQNQQQINNNDYYQNEINWIILLLLSRIENETLFLNFWIKQHNQYNDNNKDNNKSSIIHWIIHWFDNNKNVNNKDLIQHPYDKVCHIANDDNKLDSKEVDKIQIKNIVEKQQNDHNNNYEWMIRLTSQLMDRLYRIIIIIISQYTTIINTESNNKKKNMNNNNNNMITNDVVSLLLFSSWNISIMNSLVQRILLINHQRIERIDIEIIMTIDSWYNTIFSILSSSQTNNNVHENNNNTPENVVIQNKSKMDDSFNGTFCILWDRYMSYMNDYHLQSDNDDEGSNVQTDHLNNDNTNDPIKLMNLTLKTLLNQSSMVPDNNNNNNDNNKNHNDKNQIMKDKGMKNITTTTSTTTNHNYDDDLIILQVLLQHSISYIHIYYKIPIVWEKILHWWFHQTKQMKNKNNRQDHHNQDRIEVEWVKVILRLYQEYEKMIYNNNITSHGCNDNTITSSSFVIDGKNLSMIIMKRNQSNLLKLLLASIVSTSQTSAAVAPPKTSPLSNTNNNNSLKYINNHDNISLRSMSWSTFVIIFQMNNNNNNQYNHQHNNLDDRNKNNKLDNTSSILFTSAHDVHNNNKLGRFRTLCTVVRFAEGEWNIQINEFLRYLEQQKQQQKKKFTMKECYELIDSCGQVMIETIQWIILMNDNNNNEYEVNDDEGVTTTSFVLRPDAVLHLHKSFEAALTTTTECLLLLMTDYDNETLLHNDHKIPIVIKTIIRVFGALLTELDIFELQLLQHRGKGNHNNMNTNNHIPSSNDGKNSIAYDDIDDDTDDLNEYIQALYVALKHCITMMETKDVDNDTNKDDIDNEKSYSHLVGGLAMVFGSAEGDTDRIQLLKKYHLLDNIFIQFVTTFWIKHHPSLLLDNHQIIQWMCQIIELWMNMISTTATGVPDGHSDIKNNKEHRLIIANAIIKYLDYTNHHIKSNIQQLNQNNSSTTTSSLSMIIGCYITLIRVDDPLIKNKNDNEIMSPPPQEPDATVIQQTLEIIQSLSG